MSRQLTTVQHARRYIDLRSALGYKIRNREKLLLHFAKFVDRSKRHGLLTTASVLRWVRLRPHIYSERQLQELLAAAGRIKPAGKLRPLTYQTLFGLIASTGLRISEAVQLMRDDVDLKKGILRVKQTKTRKSRLVPLHPTAANVLRNYAEKRDRLWAAHTVKTFFVGPSGRPMPSGTAQYRFRQLCDELGWRRGNGEMPRPRIHDLRHSFACRRLLRWYADGSNIHNRVAALATYMDHVNVTGTYWYLTGIPELLGSVGNRFEQFASSDTRRRP